jgi:hypothetical protein
MFFAEFEIQVKTAIKEESSESEESDCEKLKHKAGIITKENKKFTIRVAIRNLKNITLHSKQIDIIVRYHKIFFLFSCVMRTSV